MRKMFLLCMLIPLFGISQTKNVVTVNRLFPKPEKVMEFEKALANHAQKYHNGDWRWRVFEIQSGPDAGGYHITEGPSDWETLDKRGDLSTEHTTDWLKNVMPFATDRSSSGYYEFETDLSNVAITDYSEKIVINHMFIKPGMVMNAMALVKKLKKVWAADNESVAVYSSAVSGPPQLSLVTRLKAGLKELSDNYRKPLPERFNAVNGEGAWNYYLIDYAKAIESRWSELLFYRSDLSSK